MTQAIAQALSRRITNPGELLRRAAVGGCALALILAGPALPSIL